MLMPFASMPGPLLPDIDTGALFALIPGPLLPDVETDALSASY
jgi:hypothetical protein